MKIIAFCFAFDGKETDFQAEVAQAFCGITRRFQPTAVLVQVSDDKTRALPWVDACIRTKRENYAQWYFDAMIGFPYKEFLRVEYDVVIKGDPWDVFKEDFDIAIAKERKGNMNNGVMFVKESRGFFYENKRIYDERTNRDNWNAIQVSTQMTIDTGKFKVLRLDHVVYNHIPHARGEYPEESKILHFKDIRKQWMLDDFGMVAA